MKVYIAGRITGDPRYREKIAEAEAGIVTPSAGITAERCPNGKPTCEKHGREVSAQIGYSSGGERRG